MNPDFNSCNSFTLSWVDQVTTGTKSYVSLIANFAAWFTAELDITQFVDQFKMRLISQLMVFQEFSRNYLNISMVPLF